MDLLPKEIEEMILQNKYQLEHEKKFRRCLRELLYKQHDEYREKIWSANQCIRSAHESLRFANDQIEYANEYIKDGKLYLKVAYAAIIVHSLLLAHSFYKGKISFCFLKY